MVASYRVPPDIKAAVDAYAEASGYSINDAGIAVLRAGIKAVRRQDLTVTSSTPDVGAEQ